MSSSASLPEIKTLSASVSVSSQLSADDLQAIRARGYQTVVNNRPDNEEPGQPGSEELEREARRLGLAYHSIPIAGADVPTGSIEAFSSILESGAVPVLAFCRSGTRSTRLWALSSAGNASPDELIDAARQAGYDIRDLRSRIAKAAAR